MDAGVEPLRYDRMQWATLIREVKQSPNYSDQAMGSFIGLTISGPGERVLRDAGASENQAMYGALLIGMMNPVGGAKKAAEIFTEKQLKNIARFEKKLPANAKESLSKIELPNGGVAVQGVSPGRVPGSYAVYEKQIDAAGDTIQYTKTTYDPTGAIVHVKDKITGEVFHGQ